MGYYESVHKAVKDKLIRKFGDNVEVELVPGTEHSSICRTKNVRLIMKQTGHVGEVQINPSQNFQGQADRLVGILSRFINKHQEV